MGKNIVARVTKENRYGKKSLSKKKKLLDWKEGLPTVQGEDNVNLTMGGSDG